MILPVQKENSNRIAYGTFSAGKSSATNPAEQNPAINFKKKVGDEWQIVATISQGQVLVGYILDVRHVSDMAEDGQDYSKMVIDLWYEDVKNNFGQTYSVSFPYSIPVRGLMSKLCGVAHGTSTYNFETKRWETQKFHKTGLSEAELDSEVNILQGMYLKLNFKKVKYNTGRFGCEIYVELQDPKTRRTMYPKGYIAKNLLVTLLSGYKGVFAATVEERKALGQEKEFTMYQTVITKDSYGRFTSLINKNFKSDFAATPFHAKVLSGEIEIEDATSNEQVPSAVNTKSDVAKTVTVPKIAASPMANMPAIEEDPVDEDDLPF